MEKFKTPLGYLEVCIDGAPVPYKVIPYDTDRTCPDLNGRYYIPVKLVPDGKPHEISCCILDHAITERDDIEPGDRLELKSFYKEDCKLSIGMEGEAGYFPDGKRAGSYDYDNDYMDCGVKYILFPDTKEAEFIFGIAWIDPVTKENDVQTWYGADPTFMTIEKQG